MAIISSIWKLITYLYIEFELSNFYSFYSFQKYFISQALVIFST